MKRLKTSASSIGLLCVGTSGACLAAVTLTSASGVVDTRLVRSADAAVAAVADTRLPIAGLAVGGPVDTGPRGLWFIVR